MPCPLPRIGPGGRTVGVVCLCAACVRWLSLLAPPLCGMPRLGRDGAGARVCVYRVGTL